MEKTMASDGRQASTELVDWGGVARALGTAARFVAIHASMLMAAAVICLFAMVIVWLLFQPNPLI